MKAHLGRKRDRHYAHGRAQAAAADQCQRIAGALLAQDAPDADIERWSRKAIVHGREADRAFRRAGY